MVQRAPAEVKVGPVGSPDLARAHHGQRDEAQRVADDVVVARGLERGRDGLEQFCDLGVVGQRRARRRLVLDQLAACEFAEWVVVGAVDVGIDADVFAGGADAITGFQFAGCLVGAQIEQHVGARDRRDHAATELGLEVADEPRLALEGLGADLRALLLQPLVGPAAVRARWRVGIRLRQRTGEGKGGGALALGFLLGDAGIDANGEQTSGCVTFLARADQSHNRVGAK